MTKIEARFVDVIILGNTIPGAFMAYYLKEKLGTSMEILLIDHQSSMSNDTRPVHNTYNRVSTGWDIGTGAYPDGDPEQSASMNLLKKYSYILKLKHDAFDFLDEDPNPNCLKKIYLNEQLSSISQTRDHTCLPCGGFFGRLELSQWFSKLNVLNTMLITVSQNQDTVKKSLDSISMKQHIEENVLMAEARLAATELVWDICGVEADKVSVLFFLCTRQKRRLESLNARWDQENTVSCKVLAIKSGRCDYLLLETDDLQYECNMLAIALQISDIREICIHPSLMESWNELDILSRCVHGKRRLFTLQYNRPFWQDKGFSGSIFSLGGPIRSTSETPVKRYGSIEMTPQLANKQNSYYISGHLREQDRSETFHRHGLRLDRMLVQLSMCFGIDALVPIDYFEHVKPFIEVPAIGDYTALLQMQNGDKRKEQRIEWAGLDLYNNCDLESAIMAGYKASINIVYKLRPQAITVEEIAALNIPKPLLRFTMEAYTSQINYRTVCYVLAASVGIYFTHSVLRNTVFKKSFPFILLSLEK